MSNQFCPHKHCPHRDFTSACWPIASLDAQHFCLCVTCDSTNNIDPLTGPMMIATRHLVDFCCHATAVLCLLLMQAQVEKVLTSWKKEKIFSEAIVDQCASNIGLTITKSGLQAAPSGVTDYAADGNDINIPSPALSAFSEPSAGSVDLAGLDSFPPKTVASANMEPPRVAEATSMPPASNASTGSSRPPEASKPIPLADLYDPCAGESYDFDLFVSGSRPAESPHVLPPLPSMTPVSSNAAAAASVAAVQPQVTSATGTEAAGLDSFANSSMQNGRGRTSNGLPPPPAAAGLPPPPLTQTPPASRKRKSRWEDATPAAAAAAEPVAAAMAQPQFAAAVAPAADGGSGGAAAPAEYAEPRTKARRSRFTDAPPAQVPLQAGQGRAYNPIGSAGSMHSMPSMQPPPPPPMKSAVEDILPPKPASARQDGEAQAAAALEAVEQMLQAKRHSEAPNNVPSTSRPKQAPMPPHQPPLPRAPPPQPPLPQLPPPQPAFTEGPAWQTDPANHTGHAMPPFQSMRPVGFPGQLPAFPHLPPMLQQGLQRGLQRPHLGHHVPQHFVQAGLQQHHRPAPTHHLPSMLQHQAAPPLRERPPVGAPLPPPYVPQPPKPQWQGSAPSNRHQSIEQVSQRPSRPAAAPPLLRRNSSEADLGHFQTTSIAMDTPTDTVPASNFVDDAVPSAPPSPPADPAPIPPPPPPPASTAVTPASSAAFSAEDDDRTAAATLETHPAQDPDLISGAVSAAPAPAGATASGRLTQLPSDLVAATAAEAEDDAHAAAPAGPAEVPAVTCKDPAELAIPEPAPDEEMDMSDG
ncbi:TPA: hypothetical protein ACH3X2_005680 [Trebouxia sp. C0005]